MMELEVGGRRFPIPTGELTIGADSSCGLPLDGAAAMHAVVVGASDGSVSVRRTGEAEVQLNSVKLGAEPAPMLHGDKLQIGHHEIFLHDPRRSGSTQFVSASELAKLVASSQKPSAPKAPTAATGGRLVCLTDGREYSIGAAPLVFGREAGCDIVVPNKDVSRRHAEILASPQGYVLVDSSTNGTWVNGDRIEGQRLLARADVIRLGDHEFRFYADKAAEPAGGAGPAPLTKAPAEPNAPTPPAPPPPTGAAERLSHTMHGLPVPAPTAPPRPVARASGPSGPMATFLVRSGSLKGERLTVRVPVVNIGRADYNDIVLPDDSVSSSHAKLQRREGVWVVSDSGSTNGTFVDGEQIDGETAISPGTVVRFGDISLMFEPTDDHLGTAAGTGTKVMGAVRPGPSPQPLPSEPLPLLPPPPPAPIPVSPPARAAAAPPVRTASASPRAPSPRPIMVSSPPSPGLPKWVIPVAVVIVLAVLAALFLR